MPFLDKYILVKKGKDDLIPQNRVIGLVHVVALIFKAEELRGPPAPRKLTPQLQRIGDRTAKVAVPMNQQHRCRDGIDIGMGVTRCLGIHRSFPDPPLIDEMTASGRRARDLQAEAG